MPPKVSVCMITYNHASYVEIAIKSILDQKCNFQIELIIGDDASTDQTLLICRDLARFDSRIRILPSEENLGVMPNFVRVLRACDGDYIAICEGDDYWLDDFKLSKQVSFLESNEAYSASAHQSIILRSNQPAGIFRSSVNPSIATVDLLEGRLFHTASLVFRSSIAETFCKAPLVLSCDRLLNLCISLQGLIHFSSEEMCVYRIHDKGLSSNATVNQFRLDLNSISFLVSLDPSFPKYRYLSYIYATIALCLSARWYHKIGYLSLSFALSFSYFPSNIRRYLLRLFLSSV